MAAVNAAVEGRGLDIYMGLTAALIVAVAGYVTLFPYPFTGVSGPGGVPFPRLVPLAAGIVLACASLYRHLRVRGQGRVEFLALPLLALVGVQALGAAGSMEPLSSFAKTGFYALTGISFYFAARTLSPGCRDAVVWAVLVCASIAGALCVIEFISGHTPLFHSSYIENNPYYLYEQLKGRSFGTLGHPVFMGALFVLALPCGYYLMGSSTSKAARALAGLLVAVSVAGLLFTFTRSAYLGALVGAAVFFRRKVTYRAAVVAVVALAVVAGLAAGSGKVREVLSRRDPVKEYVQGYEKAHRLKAFGMVARLMGDAPLLGVGVGNYRALYERYRMEKGDTRATYATPDNMYLVTLAETGLMGLGLLVYILYAAYTGLRSAAASAGPDNAAVMLMGMSLLAGFSVDMFFFDALYVEPVRVIFWTLLGLASAEA